jgi:phosphoribosylaminoimidazole-succinocarboxamide synthase
MLGREQAQRIYEVSLKLYRAASDYAAQRGMMIADTKFEFGLDAQGVLHLMDEVLTPDSSRFWTVEAYEAALERGGVPPSFDKQFIRDWLEQQGWSKTPPAPTLPADIIQKAAEKYREALHLLTTT